MINFIWAGLLVSGFVIGALTGNLEAVTQAAIDNAETGVSLALGLIGVMALWLGLMKIAEDSGFIEKLARALKPLMVKIFPDVPPEHPAMGAIIMNIAANMLGLGNAATPLGIKAMKELQTLNDEGEKDTASNAMVMFLAINTSAVTIIPVSTIAVLSAAGGSNPTSIIGPTLVATSVSTIVAIIVARTFQNLPKYRLEKTKNK